MRLIFALVIGLLACSEDDETTTVAPVTECKAGQRRSEDGACVTAGLPADAPCAPAEWQNDDGSCIPAGVPPDGCSEGFVHDGDRGCEPILPAEPCAPGLMAVPGDAMCRTIAPCATGRWGDIPVALDTEHVDASYAGTDSDGSALKPWPTIQAGVNAAAAGAIVAIAQGSYAEDVVIGGTPVRLWGVCPSQVEIVGSAPEPAAIAVLSGAPGTEVHDLAVRGGNRGVGVAGSLDVLLEHVWVHETAYRGVVVEDGFGPASITVRGSLVEQNYELAVYADGVQVTIESSVLRATHPSSRIDLGRAVHAQAGSVVLLRGSLVEQSYEHGILMQGSEVTLEGSVVRTTVPNAAGIFGRGLSAQGDPTTGAPSTLVLRGSLVEQNYEAGMYVSGSRATLENTVVRGNLPIAQSGILGVGLDIAVSPSSGAPSSVEVRHCLVEQNHAAGLFVQGSEATVEGSAIRNMLPDAEVGGRGISGQAYLMTGAPATLVVSSSLVEQNQDFGVFAEGSNVTLDASVVRATQPNAQGSFGRGVGLQAHATTPSSLLMHGSLIEQNQQIGVALSGSTASLETSVIRGSLRGVNAQPDETTTAPSQLSMLGVLVEQSLEAGVATLGSDATLDACIVRATTGGPDGRYGNGVMVISELRPASVAISASRVEQSLLAAVAVWGARAAIRGSALVCQAYDLDSESYDGSPAVLDDLGDNVCGCPEPTSSCKAVSAGLEPPAPLD